MGVQAALMSKKAEKMWESPAVLEHRRKVEGRGGEDRVWGGRRGGGKGTEEGRAGLLPAEGAPTLPLVLSPLFQTLPEFLDIQPTVVEGGDGYQHTA